MKGLMSKMFSVERKPMNSFQKNTTRRPPKAHKFMRKAGKAYKRIKVGRHPKDITERYEEKVGPSLRSGMIFG